MNLILVSLSEVLSGVVNLSDRRALHLIRVLKVAVNSKVRIGLINGGVGQATVIAIDESKTNVLLKLNTDLNTCLKTDYPIDLLLAIPRPKVLKRVLQTCSAMGVNRIVFFCSERVEKSYLNSHALEHQLITSNLKLGLEQAIDTKIPEVFVFVSWKRFLHELVTTLIPNEPHVKLLAAHPHNQNFKQNDLETLCDRAAPVMIAIGPEGGFIDSEIADLSQIGFQTFSLGERILSVETAIPYIHSMVAYILNQQHRRAVITRNKISLCGNKSPEATNKEVLSLSLSHETPDITRHMALESVKLNNSNIPPEHRKFILPRVHDLKNIGTESDIYVSQTYTTTK